MPIYTYLEITWSYSQNHRNHNTRSQWHHSNYFRRVKAASLSLSLSLSLITCLTNGGLLALTANFRMEADIASEGEEECGTLKLRSRNGETRNSPPHEAAAEAEAETGGEVESFVYLDRDEGIKHLFQHFTCYCLFLFSLSCPSFSLEMTVLPLPTTYLPRSLNNTRCLVKWSTAWEIGNRVGNFRTLVEFHSQV